MPPRTLGIFAALVSTICSSISTVFMAGAVHYLPPLFVSGVGALAGALILLALLGSSGRRALLIPEKALVPELVFVALMRGFIGGGLLIYGLSLSTAAKAVFLTKIEPYLVLLFAWIAGRETVSVRQFLLLALHVGGAILLSLKTTETGSFALGLGDTLIIVAMCCMAVTYSTSGALAKAAGARVSTIWTSGLGGVLLLVTSSVVSFPTTEAWSLHALLFLCGYILLFHVIGLSLWFKALVTIPGWLVSALRALGPLTAAPIAWLLLGESLSARQWIGGFVVVMTSACLALERR